MVHIEAENMHVVLLVVTCSATLFPKSHGYGIERDFLRKSGDFYYSLLRFHVVLFPGGAAAAAARLHPETTV